MNTRNQFSASVLGAILIAVTALLPSASAQSPAAADAKLMQSLKIPSKLEEITQLSKAGVGDTVILAYVKDSPTAYNLSATDIIKLRDEGVSPEVTAALIQRGSEVRQAAQEAARLSAATETAAAPSYQTQPGIESSAPAVTYVSSPVVVPPTSTVSVHYFGVPTYRYAPTYYTYPRYSSYGSYVTFGSGYCATPRATFSVGFGSGRYGGSFSRARYCR